MPNEIQDLQRSIAEVQSFIGERYDPLTQNLALLRQEQDRMAQQVRGVLDAQRRSHLQSTLRSGSNERPTVRGGKYDGLGHLELAICRSLQDAHIRELHGYDAARLTLLKQWQTNLEGARRALDSTTSGGGDELVPTMEAAQLWADVNLNTAVVSLFPSIQMPTNPFDIPLQLGDINFYPGTANVAAKSTDPATAKQTMTAYELTAALAWAYELDEDAAIAMLPELRASLVRNSAESMDDVLLNADTTTTNNINADGATITATDAGKAQWLLGFNGLRHIPLVDNTTQGNSHGGAVSDDMFNEIRAKLGRYGIRPSEAAFICDVNTYIRAQSVANFRTIDKLGPHATLLTGQLGDVEGIPVIVSEQMRLADTDGKVTDAGNGTDTGSLLVVNRPQYQVGFKRELLIESERDIQKRQTVMVASLRIGFLSRNAASGDTAVALQYNITGVA